MSLNSLNHLGTPELKDRVDGKDNLAEGGGFSRRVVFEDMFTPNSQKGDKL